MRALGCTLIAGSALFAACTLITDVDREKIPQTPPPTFPQADAGDASAGDGGEERLDAGGDDASSDDAGAAPDATPTDAATDAAPASDGG